MAKSIQPAWAGKLRKQLKRAGEKDSDFSRFGADVCHWQYELRYRLLQSHVPNA